MSYAGDMTPQQAWELLRENPDAVLVDVRTDAEWKYVGVPETSPIGRRTVFVEWVRYPNGARNENFVDQLKDAGVTGGPIVFLCRSGQRSIAAAEAATAAGLAPSYNILEGFEGGLDAERHRGAEGWRAAGLPWRQS
ncbi:MAG: rhodanese-like domain-containing protein [Rhodococcus sp. (in: high G+C Gram-positive bacteria)]|nr:rhodanese-like domain-containing protein [Rhodococcus sp. (in: high G+C Gram-positive bacteria)]MDX5455501.1 rhodanese-like domain-containing protein [Rhodococcus sp. (in: high G+C Gram-positive bacteria)]